MDSERFFSKLTQKFQAPIKDLQKTLVGSYSYRRSLPRYEARQSIVYVDNGRDSSIQCVRDCTKVEHVQFSQVIDAKIQLLNNRVTRVHIPSGFSFTFPFLFFLFLFFLFLLLCLIIYPSPSVIHVFLRSFYPCVSRRLLVSDILLNGVITPLPPPS